MTTNTTTSTVAALLPAPVSAFADLLDEAHAYTLQAKSPATLAIYRRDFSAFVSWCAARGVDALPASTETVALYVTERARTDKPATLSRRIAGISQAHQAANYDPPTRSARVRVTLQGIRRAHGVAQRKKTPALLPDLRAMVEVLPDTLLGTRDRALLLLGWASALRRSEIAALMVDDLQWSDSGLAVTVRRSKTDQEGAGRKVGIPFGRLAATCPVRSVRAWMDAAVIVEGPVFRSMNNKGQINPRPMSGDAIAQAVKRAARRIGKDPADFGGHSLRSGLITQAAMSAPHLSEHDLMKHTGHRSANVLRGYIRDGSLFRANPAAEAGL